MDNNGQQIRYFELCFPDGYSMLIKGTREPESEEAKAFIHTDMENLGYTEITEIVEWTREEAMPSFDFDNEAAWPVFCG